MKAEASRGVPDRRDMRLLAQALFGPLDVIEFQQSDSAAAVALAGLYVRSQRLLKALAFLDEVQLEDCADPILRSLFDLSSTFIWLSDENEGEIRLAAFVGSHHRDVRLLAETGVEVFGDLLRQAEDLVEVFEQTTEAVKRMPSIEQRLAGHPLQDHYFRYRDLSRQSHASLTAAVAYLEPAETSTSLEVSHDRQRRFASHFLAYGVMLVLSMTIDMVQRGYVAAPGDLEVIGRKVWQYWRVVEGKDPLV